MTIKVFFCCSWDNNTGHFLKTKYNPLTENSLGIWKNIMAVKNINEADWVVIIDDIHPSFINDLLKFDKTKVICIPREPGRNNPLYLRFNFKYPFMYSNFLHCWSSISKCNKNYNELMEFNTYPIKNKLCSTITSRLNPIDNCNSSPNLYGTRIEFIKRLSQQIQFLDRVEVYGYGWKTEELGPMFKGTFDGFNQSTADVIEKLLPNTTKWDGLASYSYSIAIENCCKDNYFSEKFTDCILAWTIPIYYGCPNINKYFPKDCYYWLDITSPTCFHELEGILNKPITEKQIKALEICRDLILNKYNVWNIVNDIIEKDN